MVWYQCSSVTGFVPPSTVSYFRSRWMLATVLAAMSVCVPLVVAASMVVVSVRVTGPAVPAARLSETPLAAITAPVPKAGLSIMRKSPSTGCTSAGQYRVSVLLDLRVSFDTEAYDPITVR